VWTFKYFYIRLRCLGDSSNRTQVFFSLKESHYQLTLYTMTILTLVFKYVKRNCYMYTSPINQYSASSLILFFNTWFLGSTTTFILFPIKTKLSQFFRWSMDLHCITSHHYTALVVMPFLHTLLMPLTLKSTLLLGPSYSSKCYTLMQPNIDILKNETLILEY